MGFCLYCRRRDEEPGSPPLARCTGCYQYSYCDPTCQKADRHKHKSFCDRTRKEMAVPAPMKHDPVWDATALRADAERGNPWSQGRLGICYEHGIGGVAVDFEESLRWYRRAAASPHPLPWDVHNYACSLYWGRGTSPDHTSAAQLFQRLANEGFAPSQTMLGYCYRRGHGVPYDAAKGFAWLKRAADAGYASAINSVGVSLRMGFGVGRDDVRAVECFRAAADAGDTSAMRNLAKCCWQGVGMKKDVAEAVALLERARDAGDASAVKALAAIAAGMPTPPISDEETA